MDLESLFQVLRIIAIDVVLSGDNAVVIAMAAHKLPEKQRRIAIFGGGAVAILLRIIFTLIVAFLLLVPGVRLVGGIALTWIACKLLLDESDDEAGIDASKAGQSTFAAIRMIFIADFVMSLDNMLAVAGAAGEDWKKLLMGLLVSIAIIMTGSAIIARPMSRYKFIVYLGAAILAFTAAEMILGDRELAHYFATHHHVSLSDRWEHDFMLTTGKVSGFQGENLPAELQDVVTVRKGSLEFVGQMTEQQHELLRERVTSEADQKALEEMFEISKHRDVPDWVPEGWRDRVENRFQRRWPAEVWQGIQGRQYHLVSWVFYLLVVAFCLALPRILRRGHPPESPGAGHGTAPETPPAS
ncbi:MAG: TerC family protein [Planctomycetes bacterium]|nr:TerC family protein [Planctomycetota bacterium]